MIPGRTKRAWALSFEEALDRILAGRPMPYLVDAGGKPTPRQQALFNHCTHMIILGGDEAELRLWRSMGERFQLQILAEVLAVLDGDDAVRAEGPPLRLQLGGLERRHHPVESEVWRLLADRVAATNGWTPAALWRYQRGLAPAGTFPFNLDEWLAREAPGAARWAPGMLAALLAALPPGVALAAYGGRPVWLAAALAAARPEPLVVFDARYGWLALPALEQTDGEGAWTVTTQVHGERTDLSFCLRAAHIPPVSPLEGPLPAVPAGTTLVLDGQLPVWLYAALARHYARRGNTVALAILASHVAVQVSGPTPGRTLPWR
ncbi:MAG: hypothetical protein M5U01_41890 [Ardenticatenaceae bacterium]|nr:hypothetical protein [Ardenticatenaceae bacterium]